MSGVRQSIIYKCLEHSFGWEGVNGDIVFDIVNFLAIALFSSLGGNNEQENTLNQLLVEMDGEHHY